MAMPRQRQATGLGPYLSPLGAWSLALGTSIGWGSLVITANTYLIQAGPLGSTLGMLVGMAVMMVIARNYHYMMSTTADCGGVYAYARDVFGFDHGVLTAWFLGLTYMAILWANATSLSLFARYFVGDLFQVGLHYQLFGYDVYLGEALLSIGVLLIAGAFCARHKRALQAVMVALSLVFVVGILVCFGAAMLGGGASRPSFDPTFVPGSSPLVQVMRIACMSSWAFIGFESISHSSEEFSFSRRRSGAVLAAALVASAALYVAITWLSVTTFPAEYGSWYEYLGNYANLQGLQRLPAFYAARQYLGDVGVWLLMASLLALIGTSLIGNIVALSRLMCSLARDEVIPFGLAALNERGVPDRAVWLIVAISLLAPFMGRTAIGWIVDVTTLGATIVYGFISACAYRAARNRGDRLDEICGIAGAVLMVVSGLLLLLPSLLGVGTMATESYFLFTVWTIVGFLFFRNLLRRDEERRFGKSVVVWIVLLTLTLFTSLAWFGEITNDATERLAEQLTAHYGAAAQAAQPATGERAFLQQVMGDLNGSISRGIVLVSGLFMFSLAIMLSNFSIMRRREEESERKLAGAQSVANRDPLTGVKSKHAYVSKESELNELIGTEAVGAFAIVVCDVNGLKQVNDTRGHKAGDEYIRAASMMICRLFKHSPVYRIGGDEFAVLLQGSDYEQRQQIMADLDAQSIANGKEGKVVVAAGLAEFDPQRDQQVASVFERADTLMYQRKKELKAL